MDDLLTTRLLEQILKVDRITIYRMLVDGRLRGFKVGGQWRFSRSEVEAWLRGQCLEPDVRVTNGAGKNGEQASRIFPLSCIQAVQAIFADAMDIATVTTDTEGNALTEVSNGCDFCRAILSSKEGQRRCSTFWKSFGKTEVNTCHAGLIGVGYRITTKGKWVGIVAGCQLDLRGGGEKHDVDWQENLPRLASELDLPEKNLLAAAAGVRSIRAEQMPRLSRLVKQVAETFSKIGEERLALLGRLERIAEITNFEL
jgi:excisionase family DNA binding protein